MKKSVDISSYNRSSEISKYYTINIDHWNNSEYYFLSKCTSFGRTYILQKTIHHPASLCFSRMQSSNSKTSWFVLIWVRIWYMQDRNDESSSWIVMIVDMNNFWILFLNFLDSMHQIRIRIWYAVSKIYILILLTELKSPRKTFFYYWTVVIWISEFFAEKRYVGSLLFPDFFGRSVTIRSHTFVIEQSTFLEVYQVKPNFIFRFEIGNFEIKPSCMTFGIAINSHQ